MVLTNSPGDTSPVEPQVTSPTVSQKPRFHLSRDTVLRLSFAAIGFVGLVCLLWSLSAHAVPGNSDGATVILEGKTMSVGNLTLHNWHLSLDSFWGVDVPIYAIAVLIGGVTAGLLNVVPAIIAAVVVVLGIFIAKDQQPRRAAIAGALTVVGLLALPTHAMSIFYLQGPLHVATALWCLIAFVCIRWSSSKTTWVVAVLFLAAGIDGDAQTLAFGVVPIGLAAVLAMAQQRRWRTGVRDISAGIASVIVALVVRELAHGIGTFTTGARNATATSVQRTANIHLAPRYFAKLLGVGSNGFGTGGVPRLLLAVHVVGLLVILVGVVFAFIAMVRRFWKPAAQDSEAARATERRSLDDLLFFAFVADIALFVWLTPISSPPYARYLTAAVIFGALLASRLIGRMFTALDWDVATRAISVVGIAVVCCFGASVAINVSQSLPKNPEGQLAQFLEAHHLTSGIGDYWSSSIVTVESGNQVHVRPVIANTKQHLLEYPKNSTTTWYKNTSFTFLVYRVALPFGNVMTSTAIATFGKPTTTYTVAGCLVLVWSHSLHVPTN